VTASPRRLAVLSVTGRLHRGRQPSLDDARVREGLELMLLSRLFDARATTLQRLGRWGVHSPVEGQEAAVVGACLAVDPGRDWLVPQYREFPAYIHHGMPLERIAAFFTGHPAQGRIPDGVRMLPIQVAIAAQLPHAAGLAWGLRRQGGGAVVLTYCGDGATSEGDFHEACNLAGRMQAPVVFLVQNNGWAISTPRRLQSAAPSLALRAPGYGFPGVRVDGNDLLAVHQAAAAAVARARAGAGPTLIEADTYRFGFHNTTDNPAAYADPRELAAARLRDPIERVRRYLTQRGAWDAAREAAVQERLTAALDAAVDAAARLPPPRPDECFDDIYGRPPARFLRQRAGGAAAPEA